MPKKHNSDNPMSRMFISYKRVDKEKVFRIKERIEAALLPQNISEPILSPSPKQQILSNNQTFKVGSVEFKMIHVEGGTFTMGEGSDAHQVTLSPYYIGETPVTQALWEEVMGENPSHFKGNLRPVECVSWKDCKDFIKKLKATTGKKFRLLTEAEWEFAARGGNTSKHTQYSGSNNLDEVAWYDGNSGDETHPVKQKKPNELGIYDMTGNVCEWCQDRYGDYKKGSQTNPTGPSSGSRRVGRGGSWYDVNGCCRLSDRHRIPSDLTDGSIGFRLALSE